jgi:hypothetical protein
MRTSEGFLLTRRAFLGRIGPTVAAAGILAAPWRPRLAAADDALLETPSDDEGPFYREGAPDRSDLRVANATTYPMTVSGLVRAEDGKPLPGVVLDLWHADGAGAYDMRTKDFRHRGKVKTGSDGRYAFTTNVPGQYFFADGSKRPRHVHVKLSGDGLYDLTTQTYYMVRPNVDCPEELYVALAWTGEGKDRKATGTWNPVLSRKKKEAPAR